MLKNTFNLFNFNIVYLFSIKFKNYTFLYIINFSRKRLLSSNNLNAINNGSISFTYDYQIYHIYISEQSNVTIDPNSFPSFNNNRLANRITCCCKQISPSKNKIKRNSRSATFHVKRHRSRKFQEQNEKFDI